jgi:FkbM family methyltransferase
MRRRIVEFGSEAVYGEPLPAAVADRVPLTSAILRLAWLRLLGAIGIKRMVATSGLGHQFVCHIGDLAEYPFYYRHASEKELLLAAAWLQHDSDPIIYDVGANVGYFATQLVQMLPSQTPKIYAFEAIPTTFTKLVQSVRRLGLEGSVYPVVAAVMDDDKPVRMRFSDSNSLESTVAHDAGASAHHSPLTVVHVAALTLDDFYDFTRHRPVLLKIDVEGAEGAVLRGARRLMNESIPLALMIEYHPEQFRDISGADCSLDELLAGYSLYYIDDLQDQLPFGTPLSSTAHLDWICNIFAVPKTEVLSKRWDIASSQVQRHFQKC